MELCTKTLMLYDTEYNNASDTYEKDCCVVNFIYAMTKMRFKQGLGDPAGFKQFLRQQKIKSGIIVRYVGNRLHVVFHLIPSEGHMALFNKFAVRRI